MFQKLEKYFFPNLGSNTKLDGRSHFLWICMLASLVIFGMIATLNLTIGSLVLGSINFGTVVLIIATAIISKLGARLPVCAMVFCGILYSNTIIVHAIIPTEIFRTFLFVVGILVVSLAIQKRSHARNLALVSLLFLFGADYFTRVMGVYTIPVQAHQIFRSNIFFLVISAIATTKAISFILSRHSNLFSIFENHLNHSTELVSSRSALLSLVMLDLKGPLEKLSNDIGELEKVEMGEGDRAKLMKLVSNSARIDRIVETVKSIRDGGGENLKVSTSSVSVKDCMDEVIDLLSSKAAEKEIKIDIKTTGAEFDDIYVLADRASLSMQVLQNVISNAIKFSHHRGAIDILITSDIETVSIEIQDHGIGMPEFLVSNVFDMATPTTRVGTDGEIGTGFGLPIVKNFMDAYSGKIEVSSVEAGESIPESGTKFVLVFEKASIAA